MEDKLEKKDKILIKEIEENIPLSPDPYRKIADKLGWNRDEVLKKLNYLKNKGILKRIGGILKHRKAGYQGNGMLVCQVKEDKIKKIGKKLSGYPEISHCYERESYPEWPYNIYAMVHGKNREEVENIVAKIFKDIDVIKYYILYSTEELKKSSMKYFHKE
ncbi:MAG: Lrp/AsnC family transcriptional regulator [Bacillota bacterium]